MDINQPDLFIIKNYIKKNYKALFFIIKKAFKKIIVKEDYIFITFG